MGDDTQDTQEPMEEEIKWERVYTIFGDNCSETGKRIPMFSYMYRKLTPAVFSGRSFTNRHEISEVISEQTYTFKNLQGA